MFESIRKHSKFVMILLFLLIIPSFIFVGVNQNYFTESSVIVARVDGHEIKQADWENAHRMESDRLRAENPNIDRSEEHTSELQSPDHLVCRLLLEKKKQNKRSNHRKINTSQSKTTNTARATVRNSEKR